MPRALHPDTPDAALQALAAQAAAPCPDSILTDEIAAFCQGGVSVIIALGGQGETPIAGTGSGCVVLTTGRMRLLLPATGNEALLLAARSGRPVAATFSRPVTHRSIQIKGDETTLGVANDEDIASARRQLAGLHVELRDIDYTQQFCDAYCYVADHDVAVIEFTPRQAFVQTPGPGAGAELKR